MNISYFFSLFLHIDKSLEALIIQYGSLIYFILFSIIFLETGFVIAPLLPGDSLLFVSGLFARQEFLNIWVLFILLSIAAILGDTVNYWVGRYFGNKVSKGSFTKKEYLEKTENFYAKYGGKTIILARFVPIVRTFAPFVAGVGKMKYSSFLFFNVFGGILWVGLLLFAGYLFGDIPFIKENLTIVILSIVFISILPPIFEYVRERRKRKIN